MSPSSDMLLGSHWAVGAIGQKNLERAKDLARQKIAKNAVGGQTEFSFRPGRDDEELLDRVALAYEVAAVEGLDELGRPAGQNKSLREQAAAASSRAFDMRRLFPAPRETPERLLYVLQLSSLAYCGDRGSDLRRWYAENKAGLGLPSAGDASWDQRLLYGLFDCWIRLFRKNGRDDLEEIGVIVAGLRDDQKGMEGRRLQNGSGAEDRAMALRLVALYHWAKATEILSVFMLQGQPGDPLGRIDKHFESAVRAAAASGDARHEITLRWLRAASRIMVSNSTRLAT